MSRPNKIWYWKARKCWYVTIDGRRRKLSKDKNEATKQFHRLMATEPEQRSLPADSVAAVIDDFLEWTLENRARKTYQGYRDFCQSFIEECGDLSVAQLSAEQVTRWLRRKSTWNNTTKRDAITAIQRVFNWVKRNRGLSHNPVAGMEKPKSQPRVNALSEQEFGEIISHISDEEFRDLLVVSWECGCRPQEVKQVEARHVDFERSRWVFSGDEGKGGQLRVVYMTKTAQQIVERLARMYPEGQLFRNTIGNRWTGYAVKCRFATLEKKLGKRYCQYDFRHSWITRKLIAGVDSHVVAALSGHSDTKMIDRVYSHVAEDHEFMLGQARREASSKDGSASRRKSASAGGAKRGKRRKSTR